MGLTFRLGQLPTSLFTDASNNVGIGGSPSGSYKLEVTGTAKVSSTLLVSGAATFSSSIAATSATFSGALTFANGGANYLYGGALRVLYSNGTNTNNIYSGGVNGLRVINQADSAVLLSISDTGAATFSSSVTAGGSVAVGGTNISSLLTINGTAGTCHETFREGSTNIGFIGGANGIITGANGSLAIRGENGLVLSGQGNSISMFINGTTGNVGIGTGSPNIVGFTGTMLTVNGTGNYQGFEVATSGTSRMTMVSDGSNGIISTRQSGMGLFFETGAASTKMSISSAGVVTINALGTGTVTATSGVLSAVSDMNLKIEDGYIDTALDKILKLTPRYFYWKEETGLPTDLRQLGFYAQEVNEALGEEVANTPKTENDKWGIYDRGIIAMLTKAMQEQQAMITSLQDRLDKAGL